MVQNHHVNPTIIEKIQTNPHFRNSIYHDIDVAKTLDFFTKRFVHPLSFYIDIKHSTIIDCGAGYGWFSIAYLLAGGQKAIAADSDKHRLHVAQEFSQLFGVDDRIKFINASIESLSLPSDYADIFVSIETLEHVGKENIKPALNNIMKIASQGVLITTPNSFFPIIMHDTRLPLAHWLPNGVRQVYADLFGRGEMNANNSFVSPIDLNVLSHKFRPASRCLTFSSFKEYKSHFPLYLPYGKDESKRTRIKPTLTKSFYYRLICGMFGKYSYWLMPSLSHIFIRK